MKSNPARLHGPHRRYVTSFGYPRISGIPPNFEDRRSMERALQLQKTVSPVRSTPDLNLRIGYHSDGSFVEPCGVALRTYQAQSGVS